VNEGLNISTIIKGVNYISAVEKALIIQCFIIEQVASHPVNHTRQEKRPKPFDNKGLQSSLKIELLLYVVVYYAEFNIVFTYF
jgi:hypothetical protein